MHIARPVADTVATLELLELQVDCKVRFFEGPDT